MRLSRVGAQRHPNDNLIWVLHALPVTRFATLELPTVLGLLSPHPVRPGSSPHNLYSLSAGYRLGWDSLVSLNSMAKKATVYLHSSLTQLTRQEIFCVLEMRWWWEIDQTLSPRESLVCETITHLTSSTSRHNSPNNAWTPLCYWHMSNPRIPGLYHIQGIDRIKMAYVTAQFPNTGTCPSMLYTHGFSLSL